MFYRFPSVDHASSQLPSTFTGFAFPLLPDAHSDQICTCANNSTGSLHCVKDTTGSDPSPTIGTSLDPPASPTSIRSRSFLPPLPYRSNPISTDFLSPRPLQVSLVRKLRPRSRRPIIVCSIWCVLKRMARCYMGVSFKSHRLRPSRSIGKRSRRSLTHSHWCRYRCGCVES